MPFTRRELETLLSLLRGPSGASPPAARLYEKVERELHHRARAEGARRCLNNPACAARGCADCQRSYGPRR